MEKNIKNVIKCLATRVEKSGLNLSVYDDDESDIQVSFFETNNIPLISDVRCILSAFFKNSTEVIHVDYAWGFTEIFLSDGDFIDDDVSDFDLELYGAK